MAYQRTVLKGYPDPNDSVFFEKLMSVIALLEAEGQHFVLMSDEDSQASELHQMTWQLVDDETTELAFVRDGHGELAYMSARSPKAWLVHRVIELFSSHLDTYSQGELFEIARFRLTLEPRVLLQLALISKKNDLELASLLRESLEHRLPVVRYYAARAMAITQWHIFESDLELALKMEGDLDVRSMAEYALGLCAKDVRKT